MHCGHGPVQSYFAVGYDCVVLSSYTKKHNLNTAVYLLKYICSDAIDY